MRFKSKKDQEMYDQLTDEISCLLGEQTAIENKLLWRTDRVNALLRRTRCKKVPGCRGELNHTGCHNT